MPIKSREIDLIGHLSDKYHCGKPTAWSQQQSLASPHCGDEVTLYVAIENRAIREAWHTVRGCLICQAAASFLCQWSEGQSIEDVSSIDEQTLLTLLGPLTPMRQQCAILPFRCLKQLLASLSDTRH